MPSAPRHALAGLALAALAGGCAGAPPAAEPEAERELRIGLRGVPSALDPHLQDETFTWTILANVYDGLVELDADLGLVPALAESWGNPDDLTWRFTLRDGVRFHDGRPLAASDVVSSLERARRHPRSQVASYLVAIADARVVDRRTVEVVTDRPYPILLNKLVLAFIVPADAPEEITHPVGTGAYAFAGRRPDGGVELAAAPASWRAAPAEPRAVYRPFRDAGSLTDALIRGELDLARDLDRGRLRELEADPEVEVRSRTGLGVSYLQMRVDRPPFADPRVRRAVALAVDRQAAVDGILDGRGRAIGQLVSPHVFGYVPDLAPPARDVEAARALLAEAGRGDGFDVVLEAAEGTTVAPVVAALAEVGIRVEPRLAPWSEVSAHLQAGEVALLLSAWSCTSGDASDLFDGLFHSPDAARGYGRGNSSGLADPELDRLVEESAATLDMGTRGRLLQEAMRRLLDDLPAVPLFVREQVTAARRGVVWQPRIDGWVLAREAWRRDGE